MNPSFPSNMENSNYIGPKGRCPVTKHLGQPSSPGLDFQSVFENSFNGIIVINAAGIVEHFNPAAATLFGYQREEVIGKNVSILIPSPLSQEHDMYLARYISTGKSSIIGKDRDVFAKKKDDTEFPVELTVIEVFSEGGRHFIGEVRDLTLRRQQELKLREANASLEQRVRERTTELEQANRVLEREIQERKFAQERTAKSLREKEIFLKEIHHRVKNNLQLVISILNLHKENVKNAGELQTMDDIRERIFAIAHLHETLYQSGEFGKVRVDEYLRSLVSHLVQSADEGRSIQVELDIAPITLTLDESLPCGLIINELVLNSLKHAFPELTSEPQKIEISLKCNADRVVAIVVRDNGIGYSPQLISKASSSIGLHLVEKLTQKLGGKFKYTNADGAYSEVSFMIEANV